MILRPVIHLKLYIVSRSPCPAARPLVVPSQSVLLITNFLTGEKCMLLFGSFCPAFLDVTRSPLGFVHSVSITHVKGQWDKWKFFSTFLLSTSLHHRSDCLSFSPPAPSGVGGKFFLGNKACVIWREEEGSFVLCSWHGSRDFFWNPTSPILEWEREPDLGSGGWSRMRKKIPIRLESAGQHPVWKVTTAVGQNWLFPLYDLLVVCRLDCFLNRAREVCNLFI